MTEPPPEQPYELPGTEPAWEPATLPEHPLTAERASALLAKEIGLPTPPSPLRRTTTMPEMTKADLADYLITGRLSGGIPDRKIRAAYVTGDEKLPSMLVFKDHTHSVVALVPLDAVLSVERLSGEQPQAPQPLTYLTFPKGCVCTYTWNFTYGTDGGGGITRNRTGCACPADHAKIDALAIRRSDAAAGFQTTTQVMEHM